MQTITTLEMFRKKYLKNLPADFVWQHYPLQIYPLASLVGYFTLPLPLLQTNYNFIVFLQKGKMVQQLAADLVPLEGPSILYVSLGTMTALHEIDPQAEGYFVIIEEKVISSVINRDSLLGLFNISPILKLDPTDSLWIRGLCDLLHDELTKPKVSADIGHGLLKALLHKILNLSTDGISLTRAQHIAIQFKLLAYTHFIDEKNPSFYAEKLTISENYLNRCVKEMFGRGVKETILYITILHSQFLLWDLTKSISEICYELKMENPAYFSKLFKKVSGTTPTDYRNSIMHDLL